MQNYQVEVAPVPLKGVFGDLGPLGVVNGFLVTYSLGSVLYWTQLAKLIAFMSLISLVLIMLVLPESPNWLFIHGHLERAKVKNILI